MTPEFLAAVIDTLLPGDEAMPSGTRAGVKPSSSADGHLDLFDAIAVRAGSAETFVKLDASARAALIHTVEHERPVSFRALLVILLSEYYESAAVIAALGWRSEPPQPTGHVIASADHRTQKMIDRIRQQDRLWRV